MDPPAPPDVTVCITAFNEAASIETMVRECDKVLATMPGRHSILVVNDGSTDETGPILARLAAEFPRLRVLTHATNQGQAAGHRWLIREAQADVIAHIAADGEWRASEIPRMIAKLADDYDIVIGVREHKDYGVYRQLTSWAYNTLIRIYFGVHLRDVGSIRVARAPLWKKLPTQTDTASATPERLILAHRNGARIGFVPVDHQWRKGGKSSYSDPRPAIRAFLALTRFRLSSRSRQRIVLEDRDESQS